MDYLEPIIKLLFKVPILSALFYFALFFLLFETGMSSGFKKAQKRGLSFAQSLANGWARATLFLIIPVVLWLAMGAYLNLMLILDVGFHDSISVALYSFGGMAILIFMPKDNIAQRIRTRYPTLSSKKVKKIATMWTFIYPLCLLPVGMFIALAGYAHLLPWELTISWDALWLLFTALFLNIFISKAAGKYLTFRQLRFVSDPSEPSPTEYISPSWVLWLKTPSPLRAKGGVVLVWLLISFGAINKLEFPRSTSYGLFWGYALSFSIVLVSIVSAVAGIISTILLRDSNTSRELTLKKIEKGFIAGMKGWAFAFFASFIIFFIYELTRLFTSRQITHILGRVATSIILMKKFWYTSAVISLLVAYFSQKRKKIEPVEKKH